MGKIYKIEQLRLMKDLQTWKEEGRTEKSLIQYFDTNGINKKNYYNFCNGMTKVESRALYKTLVNAYHDYTKNSKEIDLQLRYDLEDVYFTIISNLKTNQPKYKFKNILVNFRKNINPIRAFYFLLQEMQAGEFDEQNEEHIFIRDKLKDEDFFKELMYDIETDLDSLSNLETRYRQSKIDYPFFTMPITFVHTQEMVKDIRKWFSVFTIYHNKLTSHTHKYE